MKDDAVLSISTNEERIIRHGTAMDVNFLVGINNFAKEDLDGLLKSILIENQNGNERMIYFHRFDTRLGTFKMFAFMDRPKYGAWWGHWEIRNKMSDFMRFLQEKGWIEPLEAGTIPIGTVIEIRDQLQSIFSRGRK
ncbi:hypothetical protein GF325_06655 [Candidatus Bathyarchaeota archaeon]|nr:hypothetical protein [Candidatus Bathyarchaeota archaeon]